MDTSKLAIDEKNASAKMKMKEEEVDIGGRGEERRVLGLKKRRGVEEYIEEARVVRTVEILEKTHMAKSFQMPYKKHLGIGEVVFN